MSYDLMVFDASVAPTGRPAFLAWYGQQTQWTETHGYNDPDVPTPPLRAWFQEMIQTFPPLNGPLGVSDDEVDNPKVTDYSVGQSVVYAAFAWSEAEAARRHTVRMAAKHGVGFFDVSATDGDVWLPAGFGQLVKASR